MKAFVLDDSVIKRNHSKKVELLAKVYDHAEHKFQRGFSMLTLGWTDGYSFVPVGFNMSCYPLQKNPTVTRKCQIPLTIVPMVIR